MTPHALPRPGADEVERLRAELVEAQRSAQAALTGEQERGKSWAEKVLRVQSERDALKAAVDEAVDHMLKIAAWGIHDSKRSDLRMIALAIRAVAAGETTVDEMRATVERIYTSEAPGGES